MRADKWVRYFGTITGFNTVIAIATEGFCKFYQAQIDLVTANEAVIDVSYAIPLLARLLSLFTANAHTTINGTYSLGKFSVPLNIIGLVYLLFTTITFNFPGLSPVTSENMNYTSAAVGIIMLIAVVTWLTTGYRQFRGPESGGVVIDGGEAAVVADVEPEELKKR